MIKNYLTFLYTTDIRANWWKLWERNFAIYNKGL